MKISLFIGLYLGSVMGTAVYAVDVEDNVKNYQKIKEWVSFSIAEENFGRIVATRATTEDVRKNTSLALTYSVNDRCKLMSVDLIIKLNNPVAKAESREIFGNIQVDDHSPLQAEAILQNEAESDFIFLSMKGDNFDTEISKGKSLLFNFKGFGIMNFSLSGANSAINNAKKTCQNFAI